MTQRPTKHRLLTPQLYRDSPRFFVQAIAYRLIRAFTPKPLTRRLPKGLRRPLLGVGSIIPAGMPTFPGLIVPPGIEIPPNWAPWMMLLIDQAKDLADIFTDTWTPSDPLPEGVNWDAKYIFPPGWTVGDPLPPGVTAEPGAYFPAGWTVYDPFPAGFDYDASLIFPPGWTPENPPPPPYIPGYDPSMPVLPDGPMPPANLDPNLPGPVHPPPQTAPGYPKTKTFYANHSSWIWKVADTWDGAHDATEGDQCHNDLTERFDAVRARRDDPEFNINRTFFSFDLSSIPADCTITEALVTLSCYEVSADMRDMVLLLGEQTVPGDKVDFDAIGVSMAPNLTAAVGDMVYTIRATRYFLIEPAFGGTMKFCIREQNNDDADVSLADGTDRRAGIRLSGHANPALRPKLTMTYTR